MSSVRHSGPSPRAHDSVERLLPHLAGEGSRFLTLSVDLLAIADFDYRFQWVNPACEEILGYRPDELVGQRYLDLVHPDDRERTLRVADSLASTGAGLRDFENRYRAKDGSHRWLLWSATPDLTERLIYAVAKDVTDRKEAEGRLERSQTQLAEAEERFRSAFDNAPTGMALVCVDAGEEGKLLRVNDALCRMVGYSADELIGRDVQAITHPDDVRSDVELLQRLLRGEVSHYEIEKRYIHADGHVVWGLVRGSVVRDGAGEPLYGIGQVQDVTERRRVERELAHQALHDPLTGLPNRTLAIDRLGQALVRSTRSGSTVAVLFIDLDLFKVVNDGLGHQAGDRLLVAVAERLRTVLRSSDTVARFGGDEYLMVCDELPSEAHAIPMTERVQSALARPFELEGEKQIVTASIGVAIAKGESQEPDALIRDADAAMYRAKELGRARYEVFDQGMRSRAVSRLRVERDLHRALQQDELRLHYQPVVALRTGKIVELEALLRWDRPGHGLVPPSEFIETAEETGQIVAIGSWVLREVCRSAAEWRRSRAARAALPVYVNLAGRQLTQSLPDLLSQILLDSDLPPSQLGLEITESGLMEQPRGIAAVLSELHALGVNVRLDDFGTGHSSLSYLKELPIDGFKIDRSFVAGIERDTADSAIVSTISAMGKALDLTVVAEGVETAEQAAAVRILGCDLAQGFHFARPMSAEALEELLEREPDRIGMQARR